jgi:hypothetical protein
VLGGILDHPFPGVYKYGDLDLQIGGVSNGTVKYCQEFCVNGPETDCSGKAKKRLYK